MLRLEFNTLNKGAMAVNTRFSLRIAWVLALAVALVGIAFGLRWWYMERRHAAIVAFSSHPRRKLGSAAVDSDQQLAQLSKAAKIPLQLQEQWGQHQEHQEEWQHEETMGRTPRRHPLHRLIRRPVELDSHVPRVPAPHVPAHVGQLHTTNPSWVHRVTKAATNIFAEKASHALQVAKRTVSALRTSLGGPFADAAADAHASVASNSLRSRTERPSRSADIEPDADVFKKTMELTRFVPERCARRFDALEREWATIPPIRSSWTPPPKILWTHWNSATLPPLLQHSLGRMHKHMPDWDIRLLTTTDFLRLCDGIVPRGFNALTPTTQSDYIRLWLLAHYGGLWLDLSVVLNESLNPFYERTCAAQAELGGLYGRQFMCSASKGVVDERILEIESFFLCAPQRSPLIEAWLAELTVAIEIGFSKYKLGAEALGVQLGRTHGGSTYFVVYHALQVVLQRPDLCNPAVHERSEELTRELCQDRSLSSPSVPVPLQWRLALYPNEFAAYRIQLLQQANGVSQRRAFLSEEAHRIPFLKLPKGSRKVFPLEFFDHDLPLHA